MEQNINKLDFKFRIIVHMEQKKTNLITEDPMQYITRALLFRKHILQK